MKHLSVAVFAFLLVTVVIAGQSSQNPPLAANADWPMYSHDHGGTRFSPLIEINVSNVGSLK